MRHAIGPLLALVVLATVASHASAQRIPVVLPPEFADAEGDSQSSPTAPPARFQALYEASYFPELPEEQRWISAFAYRPDASVSRPVSGITRDHELRLSTTDVSPSNIRLTFDENVGPDETLVYSGPVVNSTQNVGPNAGPKVFDMIVELQTPFYYDPSQGHLLFDLLVPHGFVGVVADTCCEFRNPPAITWVARTGDYAQPVANLSGQGGGIQFLFGPKPIDGDFDRDWSLTADDVDQLATEMRTGIGLLRFDLNADGMIDSSDHDYWVKDLAQSWFGDANVDGEFSSADLTMVFAAGKYETDEPAGWAEGDWDGNGLFDSADLIAAFADGGYEQGPRAAVVPEPSAGMLLWGLLLVCARSRSRYTRTG